MPPGLLASRQSTIGGKFVAAGILVDAPQRGARQPGGEHECGQRCRLRSRRGGRLPPRRQRTGLESGSIRGACDRPARLRHGRGSAHRGGQIGDIFGKPLLGKAVVTISDSTFTNNQKGGIVVLGDRAIVKIRACQVLGDGAAALGVQNGIELTGGVKARVQDILVRHFQTAVAGKTATGLLLFGAHKARLRRGTITDVQTGIFVVGDGARVLDTQIGDITVGRHRVPRATRTGRWAT